MTLRSVVLVLNRTQYDEKQGNLQWHVHNLVLLPVLEYNETISFTTHISVP